MKKTANIYIPRKSAKANNKAEDVKDEISTDKEIQARRDEIDQKVADMPTEYGGRPKDKGLEPTRYDDWELKGRCVDF